MTKKLFALVAISGSLLLAGCNTVRGVAEDIESVVNEVDKKT